jgi:hypothetical protein
VKITFDGIDDPAFGVTALPDGYAGMNWDNFYAINTSSVTQHSGYHYGIHSGDSTGFNGSGDLATMTTARNDFSLKKGFFTAALNTGLVVDVYAYRDGVQVAHKVILPDYDHSMKVKFGHNFRHIDTITIDGTGGTDADPGDDGGPGEQVAIDDLNVKFDHGGTAHLHDHTHDHLHPHHLNHIHQVHDLLAG